MSDTGRDTTLRLAQELGIAQSRIAELEDSIKRRDGEKKRVVSGNKNGPAADVIPELVTALAEARIDERFGSLCLPPSRGPSRAASRASRISSRAPSPSPAIDKDYAEIKWRLKLALDERNAARAELSSVKQELRELESGLEQRMGAYQRDVAKARRELQNARAAEKELRAALEERSSTSLEEQLSKAHTRLAEMEEDLDEAKSQLERATYCVVKFQATLVDIGHLLHRPIEDFLTGAGRYLAQDANGTSRSDLERGQIPPTLNFGSDLEAAVPQPVQSGDDTNSDLEPGEIRETPKPQRMEKHDESTCSRTEPTAEHVLIAYRRKEAALVSLFSTWGVTRAKTPDESTDGNVSFDPEVFRATLQLHVCGLSSSSDEAGGESGNAASNNDTESEHGATTSESIVE